MCSCSSFRLLGSARSMSILFAISVAECTSLVTVRIVSVRRIMSVFLFSESLIDAGSNMVLSTSSLLL